MTDTSAPAITWDEIAKDASAIINVLTPVLEDASPAASSAISAAAKVAQGVLAEEPAAVALYDQIKSGATPTGAQMQQFAADYESAYQQLNADIAAKLASA